MEGQSSRKRAPLTEKQKKYRRDNELCMYCGDAGHQVAECSRVPTKQMTIVGVTDPETPLSHLQNAPPAGATAKIRDSASTITGLLALPREVRDQIYEELVRLDDFQVQQHQPGKPLYTDILGVCRQVYHEASAILYEKNGWVTLAAAESTITSMSCGYINSYLGFPGDSQAVTRYENDQLSRSAVLDIKAQLNSDIDPNMVDRVIPLAGMPRFCRLLTQYDSVQMLDLVLHFNHRAKDDHQSRLLGYLGQARELRRVKFTGIEPPWAVLSTIVSMTHPYTRLVEILSTVSAYQSSSKYQSNNGQTLAARNLVQDGVDFVDWWLDTIRPWMLRLEPFDETELDELIQARADMGFSCASLSIRLGSTDLAQTAIEHVLERLERTDRLDDIHKSSAHYHMAQKFEAVGWKNAALYSYLQALRLRPGYQDVDAAVDQMERSLGSGTALEDANVKHNIQSVLERFRYRPAGSAIIGIKEYRKVFQQFIGTAAEINSLNRTSRVETDLVYMNPYVGQHRYDNDDDDDAG